MNKTHKKIEAGVDTVLNKIDGIEYKPPSGGNMTGVAEEDFVRQAVLEKELQA